MSKTVVICASSRFAEEARAFSDELKKLGLHVLVPHFYRSSGGDWGGAGDYNARFIALGLTHDHFYKIRMSDVVFIYNKDGYIGNSVNMEIGYSIGQDKPIYAFDENDDEICRKALYSGFARTPEELFGLLA